MSIVDRDTIGNCSVLTMNRPEALNAITTQMLDELEQHWAGGTLSAAPLPFGALLARDEAAVRNRADELALLFGPQGDLLISSHARADGFFLHSVLGGLSFLAIMYVLFQSIFT